jgi:uncharacterized membrane protein
MTATTAIGADAPAKETASAAGTDSVDTDRRLSRRHRTVVATSLVAFIAAIVALVSILFPTMLAACIAIAVVAVLVILDRLRSPRERHQPPPGYWTF